MKRLVFITLTALIAAACGEKTPASVPPSSEISSPQSADNKKTEAPGAALYAEHCSECHSPDRYGAVGPPLLPEYFGRKKKTEIADIIRNGLPATNMLSFADKLSAEEIDQLVDFITTPVEKPVWDMDKMRATWELSYFGDSQAKPRYDMKNFFMIVEGGLGKVHFMDGDNFTLLNAVEVGAIHGGPKYGRDLKYAFAISRDGWLVKYDILELRKVGKIRGGISTRNIAVSSSGDYIAQANLLPKNLVVIDSFTMKPKTIIEPEGTPGAVYTLQSSGIFVMSLKDKPEMLVINDKTLEVSRIKLDQPFTDFFIDPTERYLVGTDRGSDHFSVLDLDKGEVVETFPAEGGMPHLASAAIWSDDKGTYAAFPIIGKNHITVMEMYKWGIRTKVEIKGKGFFARTHDNIKNIWVDSGTDTVQLIDKTTLKPVAEVVPQPGKKAMHIEFDKEGRHALVSVWEDEGEVVIYDTKTLEVKKRMPFKKPVGKYNATNKRF